MRELHGIIFSYEKRNELYELAEKRTAASLPFGGRYRCVDFVLSNLVNAGVQDVGVVLHGRYQSLLDHLGSGKSWDLSRKRGGLKILPPFAYQRAWGEVAFRGKMEALAGVRSYLQEIRQDYVVRTSPPSAPTIRTPWRTGPTSSWTARAGSVRSWCSPISREGSGAWRPISSPGTSF